MVKADSNGHMSLRWRARPIGRFVGLAGFAIPGVLAGCGTGETASWISQFEIAPAVIRVAEQESARISFVVRDRAANAAGFARDLSPPLRTITARVVDPDANVLRSFVWREPTPGYKVALWDGTVTGKRSLPPVTGTYQVSIEVTDARGHTERAVRRIRVVNPLGAPVGPRPQSGVALRSLEFDGSHLVLTDARGDRLSVRAVSGLKPHNPHNDDRIDYTQPLYQFASDRGPIPEREYVIIRHSVQQPELVDGVLLFPSGASVKEWGPMRALIRSEGATSRSGFFVHLDVENDGTAGCIGVHPDDEGKLNHIMSLLAWMPNERLDLTVRYPSPSRLALR